MKITKHFKGLLILFLFITLPLAVRGQASDIPAKPNPPRLVNDFAGFLTADEQNQLEHKLVAIDDSTSTQIAIVIVKSLNGYDINDMGTRIIEKWGIGQKDKDNGLLILVKPKTDEENGQVAIITGYGLEHLVTDILAKQIVQNEIIPYFRKDQNFAGLNQAVDVIYSLTKGEFSPTQYLASHKKHKQTGHFPFAVVIILIVLAISFFGRSSNQSGGGLSTGSGLPFWLLLGGLMGGQSQGGAWGSFSSGNDDFGGFGGGDSGGGGASGSW